MSEKIKLSNPKLPTIDPDEITLVFGNAKQYAWRLEHDEIVEDGAWYDDRVENPVPDETVANYMTIGVSQPVFLYEENGRVYSSDGIQRIKGLRMANKLLRAKGEPIMLLKYILKSGKDKSSLAAEGTSINAHRTDNSMIQNARRAAKLIEVHGWSKKDAANYFRVSVPAINNWLKIAKLSPKVIKAIESGFEGVKISATTAIDYADLEHEEQNKRLKADVEAIKTVTPVAPGSGTSTKKASAAKIKKANRAEPPPESPEKVEMRLMDKVRVALEALTPEQRLRIFAEYDADGIEKAQVYPDAEEAPEALKESDVKELQTEYDDAPPPAATGKGKASKKRAIKKK